MNDDGELFNVVRFSADGYGEYLRRSLPARDAVHAAHHYCHNLDARVGLTRRVIITDGGDDTVFEWKYGEGVTFPPPPPKSILWPAGTNTEGD
jgi:hypothetical protein